MKERFKVSDGDAWYDRNKDYLDSHADIVLEMIDANKIKPNSALEVGCANGYRLHTIANKLGAECEGIDISIDAVGDGGGNKNVKLHVGDISNDSAYIKDGMGHAKPFDLVIVNFVLHWIDRERLYQTIANIDANVGYGGYLIIGDFYDYYKQVVYKHREDLYTWKMDYAKIFTLSGNYIEIDKMYFEHDKMNLYTEGEMGYNMGKITVLQKRSIYELVD
jgi:SAM-dependent methyltransferase